MILLVDRSSNRKSAGNNVDVLEIYETVECRTHRTDRGTDREENELFWKHPHRPAHVPFEKVKLYGGDFVHVFTSAGCEAPSLKLII